MNKFIILLVITTLTLTLSIGISSAATPEITTGKLPVQLHEGDQVSFNLKIKVDDSDKNITIETSLIPSNNVPIYDFGALNPSITDNRYNQKITLNTSSTPSIIEVNISGKVPEGEIRIKPVNNNLVNTNLVISKFIDTKLKYYELRSDQKLDGIETFELVINKKENFENTLKSIRRPELDGMKTKVRKLFDLGLPTEAQDIATEMSNIKFPDSLTLVRVIKVSDDLTLNIIYIVSIIFIFFVGYILGSRTSDEDETEEY